MRIAPRHIVFLNGLTVIACVLHVLVHAAELHIGEWHDYAVYTLVVVSFVASFFLARQPQREPLTA